MPLFRFAKQWLDLHRPFAHRLGVGLRAMVRADPLAGLSVERAIELPARWTVGPARADRARLTRGGGAWVTSWLPRKRSQVSDSHYCGGVAGEVRQDVAGEALHLAHGVGVGEGAVVEVEDDFFDAGGLDLLE